MAIKSPRSNEPARPRDRAPRPPPSATGGSIAGRDSRFPGADETRYKFQINFKA